MKNIGGRPIKLTDSVIENILYGIAHGLTLKASCKLAGVSYSTLAWWLSKGKQAKRSNIRNKYTDVLERINHATHAEKIKHRNNFFLI
jgi:DNA invertase Pin-like site-specific DNA recombinase